MNIVKEIIELTSEEKLNITKIKIPKNVLLKREDDKYNSYLQVYQNKKLIGRVDLVDDFNDGIIRYFSKYYGFKTFRAKSIQGAVKSIITKA